MSVFLFCLWREQNFRVTNFHINWDTSTFWLLEFVTYPHSSEFPTEPTGDIPNKLKEMRFCICIAKPVVIWLKRLTNETSSSSEEESEHSRVLKYFFFFSSALTSLLCDELEFILCLALETSSRVIASRSSFHQFIVFVVVWIRRCRLKSCHSLCPVNDISLSVVISECIWIVHWKVCESSSLNLIPIPHIRCENCPANQSSEVARVENP